MAQVLGIIDILWRGSNIPVEKGAKLKLGGIKNNPVTFGRKVARAQEFMGSEITATTNLERGISYGAIYSEGEGELQVTCDTGHIYTFPDAFLTDIPEMTGGEGGKLEMKWSAGDYEEVMR
ncbi:MAG TPA: phage tail tube protein [Kaistia sp.]|nr:phage tail tube protein [Kaistia sp.]